MSHGTTLIGSRIDADLYATFKDWVGDRHGSVNTHLRQELEHALRNHMELSETGEGELHIDLLREEIAELRAEVARLSEPDTQKEKTKMGDTVDRRADEITSRLQADFGTGPISRTAFESVVRDVAGGSDPTIRQYRNILSTDGQLFENPSPGASKEYVYGERAYVTLVQSLAESGAMTQPMYDDAVDQIGTDRFEEIVDTLDDDRDRAFA